MIIIYETAIENKLWRLYRLNFDTGEIYISLVAFDLFCAIIQQFRKLGYTFIRKD